MLIRFLISRSGQAGASSTRNRQRAWPPLKKGPTGRSEGHIGHGGLCRPDDWKTATKGRRREAVLFKSVAMVTHVWCNCARAQWACTQGDSVKQDFGRVCGERCS